MTTRVSPIGSPTFILLNTDDKQLQETYNQMDAALQAYWGRGFRNVEDYALVTATLAIRSRFLVENGFFGVDEAWEAFRIDKEKAQDNLVRSIKRQCELTAASEESSILYIGNLLFPPTPKNPLSSAKEEKLADDSNEERVFSEEDVSD
jgi:hypothetical protein